MPFDGTNFDLQDDLLSPLRLSLLRRARERVARPGGWCQCEIESAEGAVCMLGAIQAECRGPDSLQWMVRRDAWLELCGGLVHGDGIAYNDTPGRTQAEIVALFDCAIAKCEAELQTGRKSWPKTR